jgi:hypothetical protein
MVLYNVQLRRLKWRRRAFEKVDNVLDYAFPLLYITRQIAYLIFSCRKWLLASETGAREKPLINEFIRKPTAETPAPVFACPGTYSAWSSAIQEIVRESMLRRATVENDAI